MLDHPLLYKSHEIQSVLFKQNVCRLFFITLILYRNIEVNTGVKFDFIQSHLSRSTSQTIYECKWTKKKKVLHRVYIV